MSQPILSIQSSDAEKSKSVANLLPCRIHHNGSIDPTQNFWNPTISEDGTKTAYFRGRKLHGQTVGLPEEYRGVILEKMDKTADRKPEEGSEEDQDQDQEHQVETGAMQVKAEFDEMIVWGHESTAEASTDPYLRSMGEWLQVAAQIHSYPAEEKTGK